MAMGLSIWGHLRGALSCVVMLGLLSSVLPVKVGAEQITVGWTPVPGLMQEMPDGRLGGFMIDLARALTAEAQLDLRLERYETVPDLLAAQAMGRSEMLAGVVDLPSLRATSHYSDPLAQTRVSIFRHRTRGPDIDPDTASGLRFGAMRGASGSELVGVLLRNELTTFSTLDALFHALDDGSIDAFVGPGDAFLWVLEARNLSDAYEEIPEPIQVSPRVVALHHGRTELRSRIDAAVVTLETSGKLDKIRERWGMAPPQPQPQSLTVGMLLDPPFVVLTETGELTGFSVEVMRDLAELSGLSLTFQRIAPMDWREGPSPEGYDLMSLVPITSERSGKTGYGLPILTTSYSVFGLRREAGNSGSVDWSGVRLGVLSTEMSLARRGKLAEARAIPFGSRQTMIFALLTGRIDAVLNEAHSMRRTLSGRGLDARIVEWSPEVFDVEHAIGYRAGLQPVVERMDAAVPGYLASPRYVDLKIAWLHERPHWAVAGLSSYLGATGAAMVLFVAGMGWQRYQRRLSEARRDIAEDLIDKIPLGLILLGRDGRIKYVNEVTASTRASTSGMLSVGRCYVDAVRDLVDAGRADLAGMSRDQWIDQQIKDIRTDGCIREVQVASGPIFVRTTKLLRGGETLLLRQDVTEERARLRQIQMLNEDLQDQIRLARAATEDLRAFAYATSHDLKSPTNTAIMIAAALSEELEGKLCAEDEELLSDLRKTLVDMSGLIDDVQSYTNAIGPNVANEDLDLEETARAAILSVSDRVRRSGADVTLAPLDRMRGSPGQLRILLANLIDNAIKFCARGRTPVVAIGPAAAPEGFVGLAVTDNGIGIDAAHRDRIFQLFQRLNPTTDFGGNGLGLAICQRIALNHGGRISVASTPGQGSTFTVFLRKEIP